MCSVNCQVDGIATGLIPFEDISVKVNDEEMSNEVFVRDLRTVGVNLQNVNTIKITITVAQSPEQVYVSDTLTIINNENIQSIER